LLGAAFPPYFKALDDTRCKLPKTGRKKRGDKSGTHGGSSLLYPRTIAISKSGWSRDWSRGNSESRFPDVQRLEGQKDNVVA
jgi:hypothetical protein